ncbi:hypothetical protein J6590_063373 [Homalodisca vitripennis]|nr:hypothetical protein J6590_063373 [Homalodisca vitripennis]
MDYGRSLHGCGRDCVKAETSARLAHRIWRCDPPEPPLEPSLRLYQPLDSSMPATVWFIDSQIAVNRNTRLVIRAGSDKSALTVRPCVCAPLISQSLHPFIGANQTECHRLLVPLNYLVS